ncbi:MAG: hypothetical protein NC416_18280 [Eubacterium sp.]|nr:hypothetical protein [Eubacterium sp.]
MKYVVPFILREKVNKIYIDYQPMPDAQEAGFTALKLPFDVNDCLGYPMLHAYFGNSTLRGYERYCAWIQIIERREYTAISSESPANISFELDASAEMKKHKLPYFGIGYPAEFFDAPCKNLGDSAKLDWRAYTYLVDPPSRMNGSQLVFLTGFTWGYTEDQSGNIHLLDFKILSEDKWTEHQKYITLL